jgi:RimJ/RimL family protein N-acetyltransferase
VDAGEAATHLGRAGVLPVGITDRQGEPYRVRSAGPPDREALEAFYEAFDPKRSAQGLPPGDAERIGRWLDSILPYGIHLLLLADERLVGHAFLAETSRPDTLEYAVFVGAAARGRGLGSALNRLAVESARALGVGRIWLTVQPHNRAAIRSYERAGFVFRPETIYASEMEMELRL